MSADETTSSSDHDDHRDHHDHHGPTDPIDPSAGEPTVRYLGLAWIRELTREVAESEALAELANEHTIGVTQVVTAGPEGDVTYHLQVGDGSATFGAGPADPEDVRMQQEWSTAVAVATGAMNAQEAFITGKILLFGDQQKLLTAQPVFGALDHVFSIVRERTRYE
jgi:putative sterol carrier protein